MGNCIFEIIDEEWLWQMESHIMMADFMATVADGIATFCKLML